jgi:hypothetical protein
VSNAALVVPEPDRMYVVIGVVVALFAGCTTREFF